MAGAVFASQPAFAASQVWSGAESGSFSVGDNWSGGAAPGSASGTANGDTATFGNDVNTAVTVDATRNIKNITFDTGAGAFQLAGGGLMLTASGAITMNAGVANTETISSTITLASGNAKYALTNNSGTEGADLLIDADIAARTTGIATLSLNGSGNGTISGVIGDGSGGGTVALTKSGAGTWTLSAANSYTGATVVNEGTLKLGADNALGASGAALTVTGTGTGVTATVDLNGFDQTIGVLTLGGAAGATGSTTTSASRIIGSGTLTSAGTITYSPANSPLGATISVDTLDLNGATRTVYANDSLGADNDLTITSTIQNGVLSKNGAGTLLLTGSNTISSSAIQAGTLSIGNDHALGTGALTFNAGTVQSDGSVARVMDNTVTLGNKVTVTFGGTGDLTFGAMTVSLTDTVIVNNGVTTVSSISNGSQVGTLVKQGPGALAVKGDTSYTNGVTDIQGGILAVAGKLSASSAIKLNGGVIGTHGAFTRNISTAGGLNVQWVADQAGGLAAYGAGETWGDDANNLTVLFNNNSSPVTWGSAAFVSSGAELILGSSISNGTVDIQNGLDLAGTTQTVRVNRSALAPVDGVDAKLSGVISNGGFAKRGMGVLEISADNTYTGATAIDAGTVLVNGSLSADSAVTVGDASDLAAAAVLGGTGTVGNVTVGAAANNTGATLAPGAAGSIGSLTTKSLTFSGPGAHLAITLGATAASAVAGVDNDAVNTTGSVTLAGADLVLTLQGDFTTGGDQLYLLINNTSEQAGGTDSLGELSYGGGLLAQDAIFTVGGQQFQISYTADFSSGNRIFEGTGNDVALMAVPEPGALGAILGGLAPMLLAWRSRRRGRLS